MKNFRRIYIYKDTKMPDRGWLQGCFICYQITGRLLVYETVEKNNVITEYAVFLCPTCQNNLKKDKNYNDEFKTKCQQYININGI